MIVFVGASTATTLNRIQHSAETNAPHQHMILSDLSYLADHDDRLHASEHHSEEAKSETAAGHNNSLSADVHSLIGGEHDGASKSHLGHHHHHQGETGSNVLVLGSVSTAFQFWWNDNESPVRERTHGSVRYSLPERPPRSLENRA